MWINNYKAYNLNGIGSSFKKIRKVGHFYVSTYVTIFDNYILGSM